jgi:hypothetical protein
MSGLATYQELTQSAKEITSEQGTAWRCQWCQKLRQSEMLTWTWLGS